MSKIQDDSLFYNAFRGFVGFLYPTFFRRINVRGTENIPLEGPVIFAPNHQEGLMDALAVLFHQPRPIVFMARADIFQSKQNQWFLKKMKVTPIFRVRDGFENLSRNEAQMETAVGVLLDGKQLCLMPEGNQGNQRKLRPLVKGIFRIACAAEEHLEGASHVRIVPVGIDYSFYRHAGADLIVHFGMPIEVKDYMEQYDENPVYALNELKDALARSMSERMHDIRSIAHNDAIYRLSCFGMFAGIESLNESTSTAASASLSEKLFDTRRVLSKSLDTLDAENPKELLDLDALCSRLNTLPGSPVEIAEWMNSKSIHVTDVLLLLAIFPLLPGFLLNIPAWFIHFLVCRKVEDTQMHSTFAFTFGILINGFVYTIASIFAVLLFHLNAIQAAGTLVAIVVWGIAAERTRQRLRIPFRKSRYLFGKKKDFLKACLDDYEILKSKLQKHVTKNREISVSVHQ